MSERVLPSARRMPISDDRWITEIDITLAMPSPPTARARIPANSAVCCSVLSACADASSASLGIFVRHRSVPPRLIAVGIASFVSWVVPGSARTYIFVGAPSVREVVLRGPLGDERGVVEVGIERDAVEHADDAVVDAVERDRADLARGARRTGRRARRRSRPRASGCAGRSRAATDRSASAPRARSAACRRRRAPAPGTPGSSPPSPAFGRVTTPSISLTADARATVGTALDPVHRVLRAASGSAGRTCRRPRP